MVGALLAADFREFGSSGRVYDKAMVVETLAAEMPGAHSALPMIVDFAAQRLAPDVVLVTYCSVAYSQEDSTERTVLRSSIWQRVEGTWLMVFHQGTPVPSKPRT